MAGQELAVTIPAPDAGELIAHGGLARTEAGWLLPDGTCTGNVAIALTRSLAMIAQKQRDESVIELDSQGAELARVGLNSILAEPRLSEEHRERASALLDTIGAEPVDDAARVCVSLAQHRLTLLAALVTRVETLRCPEDDDLLSKASDLMLKAERRGWSEWFDGGGEW